MPSKQEILERFKQINVWKKGDERAPHKPLLLLYALGRCSRNEGNEIPYLDVERDLKYLLTEFGPPGSPHPEMPFWYLQNDGIWFVNTAENLERRKGRTDPKRSEFIKHNPIGGIIPEIYNTLSIDKQLLNDVVRSLLVAHFPESFHDDILDAVGLAIEDGIQVHNKRDPTFRQKVLRAYGHRCAVCGYDLKLGAGDLGLEAAHIKWYQAGGPDVESNGLALCVLHHKLFDRGAFSLEDDLTLLVSQEVHGSTGLQEVLLLFHGHKVISPQSESYIPLPVFLQWHRREVFRGPSRD
jgi:putative restriction endonuclease